MKLTTALKYRLKYIAISGSIYFGFFVAFAIIFPLLGVIAIGGSQEEVFSDLLFSPLIYGFIMAFIGVNSDFKLFIQNGVSRKTIFITNIISNLIQSFGLAAICLLLKKIVDSLPLFENFTLSTFFLDVYSDGNLFKTLFIFTWILFFGTSIALLAGTFNDRVQGMKKIVIILLLIMIPTGLLTLFPIASGTMLSPWVETFVKLAFGFQNGAFHLLPVTISLLVGMIICLGITYLLNVRREVRRLNA